MGTTFSTVAQRQKEKFKNDDKIIGFLGDRYDLESYYTKLTVVTTEQNYQQISSEIDDELTVFNLRVEQEISTAVREEVEAIIDTDHAKKNKILIVGEPGIGKSTLIKHICYQWAEKELWTRKFKHLWSLELKELNEWLVAKGPDGYINADGTIREFSTTQEKYANFIYYVEKKKLGGVSPNISKTEITKRIGGDKELFLLDGYDEILSMSSERQLQKKMKATAADMIKTFNHVLTTSRPNAPYEGGLIADRYFTKIIKNIGFNKEGREEYIKRYYHGKPDEKKRVAGLISFIEQNENVIAFSRDSRNGRINNYELLGISQEEANRLHNSRINNLEEFAGEQQDQNVRFTAELNCQNIQNIVSERRAQAIQMETIVQIRNLESRLCMLNNLSYTNPLLNRADSQQILSTAYYCAGVGRVNSVINLGQSQNSYEWLSELIKVNGIEEVIVNILTSNDAYSKSVEHYR